MKITIELIKSELLPRCDATVEDISRHKEPRCSKTAIYRLKNDDFDKRLCRHHASQEALELMLEDAGYDRSTAHQKRRKHG